MRTNLKVFRVKNRLSQSGMARRIGCSRAMYGHIERGFRNGTVKFWDNLKNAFEVSEKTIERLKEDEN